MVQKDYYKSIGFMCGLEIHQRLATSGKLFCSCTTLLHKDEPLGSIERRQRAVAGELGTTDQSAEFEEQKARDFVYKTFRNSTCLVDVDEEPPHHMNPEALAIALALAKSMDMRIVDELQPMRKGVVDGSDPSAFQRTSLVALEGKIKVNKNIITIPSLFVEEESSGIAESDHNRATYDTSRLGIPLIEIDTDPTIPDPQSAKDVALYIGTLLRITGKVQRGIGSIRQDVNMSIKGGARVEIKGMQELGLIDRFIENEIKRQQELLKIKEDLTKAKASVGKPKEITKLFPETNVKILGSAKCVVGFRLEGFKGVIGREVNPQRRLGTEMSDYAKASGVKGLIHSDEDLQKYGFTGEEISAVNKALGISANDAFVIISGDKENAHKAASAAAWRAEYALKGVPKETRGAISGDLCTSKFLRPLPGGSRMYPETDVRTISITEEMLEEAEKSAPNLETEKKFLGSKVKNPDIADQLLLSPRLQLFKDAIRKTKADPEFVANTLIQKFTELKRLGYDCDGIEQQRIYELFDSYSKDLITKSGAEEVLKELAKSDIKVSEIIRSKNLKRIKGKELETLVKVETKEKSGPDALKSIMAKYRAVVDGKELNDLMQRQPKSA